MTSSTRSQVTVTDVRLAVVEGAVFHDDQAAIVSGSPRTRVAAAALSIGVVDAPARLTGKTR